MRLSISISAICCTPSEMRREGVRREIESVFDCNQVEALRRSGRTGSATVACGENGCDLRRRNAALPYQQKGPDKVAHHVVQEAVAADDVDELLAPALEARLMDHANVGGVLGFGPLRRSKLKNPTSARRRWGPRQACCWFAGVEKWGTNILLQTNDALGTYGALALYLGTACAAVGVDRGKGGEVVLTNDERGGLLHGGFIQRIRMVRDVA